MAEKDTNKKSLKSPRNIYNTEDYKRKDSLSSGLATTHEQVSDVYMEGEIHPIIDDMNGKDIEIKSK